MKYNAVIFDLDGVICHTDRFHYLAWKEIADRLGIYFDERINNSLRGVSRMESLEIILQKYDGKLQAREKKDLAEMKNEIYRNLLSHMTQADLEVETSRTFEYLRSKGVSLAIGSSSKNAKLILKQIGLESYFDAVSDGNNISRSKPDPEVFIKASEMLGVEPAKCLVVEDSEAGMEAAAAAGMDCAVLGAAAEALDSTVGEAAADTLDSAVADVIAEALYSVVCDIPTMHRSRIYKLCSLNNLLSMGLF